MISYQKVKMGIAWHHSFVTLMRALGCWTVVMVIVKAIATAALTSNSSDIKCGPRGNIRFDASPDAVTLVKAWAAIYHRACPNTTLAVTASNSSSLAAQHFCALTPAASSSSLFPVDVAVLSRPFRSSEARSSVQNGFKFTCAQGNKSRTAIQVQVAYDAFVLVVAPNGTAAYCIKELFGNGLTLQQLRILYSDYSPTRILNISTPSPSAAQFTSMPSNFDIRTPPPVAPPVFPPFFPPNAPPNFFPHKPPVNRPSKRPTKRPNLPPSTRCTISWGLGIPCNNAFPRSESSLITTSAEEYCSRQQALVAGPSTTAELFHEFAQRILSGYGRGETIKSNYAGFLKTDNIIRYLMQNPNAIAFVSLPEYVANKQKLVLVNVKDKSGKNRGPKSTALRGGQYPLRFNLYMEVRSDEAGILARIRPFFVFAFTSSQGMAAVVSSGVVPLSNATAASMVSRIMSGGGKA